MQDFSGKDCSSVGIFISVNFYGIIYEMHYITCYIKYIALCCCIKYTLSFLMVIGQEKMTSDYTRGPGWLGNWLNHHPCVHLSHLDMV